MNQRKPKFLSEFGFLGRCIAYPVTVHISNRQWQDKWVLVPVNHWRKGERTFSFLHDDFHGTTFETYTCTPKVTESIQKAMMAYHSYIKQQEELRRLQDEINDIKDYFANLSKNFDGINI